MAAELITPTDELTGIPLSVAPPLFELSRHRPDVANWHHLYHPSSAPELATLGGVALRNSRIQLLPVHHHNVGRHTYHTFYTGPPLPAADDEETQFRLCVMSAAGYLPRTVIDLSSQEPVERPITEDELRFFRKNPIPQRVTLSELNKLVALDRKAAGGILPKHEARRLHDQYRVRLKERNQTQARLSYNILRYAYDPIREFFKEYALKQPAEQLLPYARIDEFLHTERVERRQFLGHLLLAKQSEAASESVTEQYRQAFRAGLLHPLMPPSPQSLVKNKLGDRQYREERIFPQLAARLAAAA